jgi:hypothetical protein
MGRGKESPGRYVMWSHHQEGDGRPDGPKQPRDEWQPMQDGAAGHVWRPRETREEAVAKCLHWTGMVCIPPMRVTDAETGAVLWQRAYPPSQWRTGPDLVPSWAVEVEAQVEAEIDEDARLARREETGWEIRSILDYLDREHKEDDHADDPKYRWRPYNRTETRLGCEVGWDMDSEEPGNGPWTRQVRGCVWGAAEVLIARRHPDDPRPWERLRGEIDLLVALEATYQAHKHDPALAHPKGGIDPIRLAGRHRRRHLLIFRPLGGASQPRDCARRPPS